ncbi:bis(5'-adenosyl)-triphosphatase enpp4 isoform X2 [Lampris incognitus]|uniref:bis(5'-adenosyl)-triphosphatase enpp4 isoform X2 n=1 Tax=Lampris incognitus TaxID=2546036 RepID=UPI0024B57F79|nr:bis(5'-adenosyl)-triphosphatase enpp4 isoform X2 [Lampris incognitus]
MFIRITLGFLCGLGWAAAAWGAGSEAVGGGPLPLLLVSFDGFRADYLQRFPMPNLKLLYSQGVLVEQLTNVFITKTFPNHYSLVTGLYAESHGILSSSMYDPVTDKNFSTSHDTDPFWWNQAEPLWITALDSGYQTAAVMWPGADVTIGNRTATHFFPYDPAMTFRERLGNVTGWMAGNGTGSGVMFAALYWEEPDRTGHIYGPDDTTAMAKALKEVDDNIGLLMTELKRAGLWGRVNVLVTSDHGMAQCSDQRLIRLDNCLHPDNYTLVDLTPVAALIPKRDPDAVFSLLSKCHPHMTAYLKNTIPDRLHYRNNKLIQPILLVADEGWTIVQRGDRLPRLGDHGYDNALPSMHPFLAAAGPSFRQGYRATELQSVDIYPLMCHLLAVHPRPNNGTLAHSRCMLSESSCMEVPMIVGLVIGVLLLLATITALFRLMKPRQPLLSRPFQRLQLEDDDDDDDPLLE